MGIEVNKENYAQVRAQNNDHFINSQLNGGKSILTKSERKSKEIMDMSDFPGFKVDWSRMFAAPSSGGGSGGGGFLKTAASVVGGVLGFG